MAWPDVVVTVKPMTETGWPSIRAVVAPRAFAVRAGMNRFDVAVLYGAGMAKAARVLAALKRDGWIETRRSGSHRVLAKGDQQRIRAYHGG